MHVSAKNGRREKDQHMDCSRKKWAGVDDAETRNFPMFWSKEGEGHISY